MSKEKNRSRGLRIAKKQCKFEEIKNEIIKTEKTRKGAKKSKINEILSCTPQLKSLYFGMYPAFEISIFRHIPRI